MKRNGHYHIVGNWQDIIFDGLAAHEIYQMLIFCHYFSCILHTPQRYGNWNVQVCTHQPCYSPRLNSIWPCRGIYKEKDAHSWSVVFSLKRGRTGEHANSCVWRGCEGGQEAQCNWLHLHCWREPKDREASGNGKVLSRSLLINIASYKICQILRLLIAGFGNLPNLYPPSILAIWYILTSNVNVRRNCEVWKR